MSKQIALEALNWSTRHGGAVITHGEAIAAIKEALVQRQLESTIDMMMELADRLGALPDDIDPSVWEHLLAYAPQRTWVGLTEEEMQAVAKQARSKDHAVTLTNKLLKEKNT